VSVLRETPEMTVALGKIFERIRDDCGSDDVLAIDVEDYDQEHDVWWYEGTILVGEVRMAFVVRDDTGDDVGFTYWEPVPVAVAPSRTPYTLRSYIQALRG
jgi:hypothetical protein